MSFDPQPPVPPEPPQWPATNPQQPAPNQQGPTAPQQWPTANQQRPATNPQWPAAPQQWPAADQQWTGASHQWPGANQQWHGQEQYQVRQQPQTPQWEPLPQPGMVMQPMVAPKSPALSVLLSVFIPGLGSMVNDHVSTGVTILLLNVLGLVLAVFLIGIPIMIATWIWGLVDAYQSAQRWNAAHGIIS